MARRFARFKKPPRGKASPAARLVHRAADYHARANPMTFARAARTEQELADMVRAMAAEGSQYMRVQVDHYLRLNKRAGNLVDLRRELIEIAGDFEDVLAGYSKEAVRLSYGTGKAHMTMDLSRIGLARPPQGVAMQIGFNTPDRAAMAAIASDLFTDIAGQTKRMPQRAVALLRDAAAYTLRRELVLGTRPFEAAKKLEMELVRQGFTPESKFEEFRDKLRNLYRNPFSNSVMQKGIKNWTDVAHHLNDDGLFKFIDKGGNAWSIEEYCRMVSHTKLMMAHNEGCLNRMTQAGVNHYRFSDHNTTCPICGPLEGRVFWTGVGNSRGYPKAPTIAPIHPRCAHTLLPEILD